jgi:hypothetical protein
VEATQVNEPRTVTHCELDERHLHGEVRSARVNSEDAVFAVEFGKQIGRKLVTVHRVQGDRQVQDKRGRESTDH